ncbi:transposase [Variovorax gossypii]
MFAKRRTPPNQLGLGLNLLTKKTRKREFLDEMDRVVPWGALVQIVEPHSPRAKTGRPPFAIETMLRSHYLQQWFGLSDPAMEEVLHDVPLYREFAGPGDDVSRLPDETTNPFIEPEFVAERVEKMKASIRAKVGHPFRVIKQQFGFTKMRYRGLAKNTAQIVMLFALSNLRMARRRLMGVVG